MQELTDDLHAAAMTCYAGVSQSQKKSKHKKKEVKENEDNVLCLYKVLHLVYILRVYTFMKDAEW